MAIFKRGGIYWIEFQFEGRRYRTSTKQHNKKFALDQEITQKNLLLRGAAGLPKRAKAKTCSVAMTEVREANKPRWQLKTQKMHENSQLHHLDKFFGKMLLSQVTAADIEEYQKQRHDEDASGRSINIEIALLRLAMKKAKLWANIADDVRMLPENKDIGRELSDDEADRLLAACKASASRSLYPAVLTSIHTGLRNAELRGLKWRQINLQEGFLVVGKSKTVGGSGRVVPLSEAALEVLQGWRAQFPASLDDHYVFPSEAYGTWGTPGQKGFPATSQTAAYFTDPTKHVQTFATAWRTAKKAAGVECRWHDLRHSWVSRIAAAGAMDGTIQSMAGWMSPKMLATYSHPRNQAKRDAISAAFNRVPTESPQ